MVQNHLANARERSERLEDLRAELNVRLHGFPFIRIERAALVQNIFGNADLADVVEDGAKSNFFDFYVGHVQGFGDERGVSGNLLRVALSVVILGVDGEGQGRDGIEDRLRKRVRSLRGG